MPIYSVQGPDGRIYDIEGPAGASNDQIIGALQAHLGAAPAPQKQSSILGEIARGAKQLYSSSRTGIESLVNPEAAAVAGLERSKKIGEEAGEGVSLEAVKKAYADKGLLSAAGEAVSQIPRAVAGQIPQMGATIAGASTGAALGSIIPGVGNIVGGIAGAGLSMLPQFAGSNVERQAQEQQEAKQPIDINRASAYGAAVGQAALEGAGTAFTLGKTAVKGILGIAADAALKSPKAKEELVKIAAQSVKKAAGMGAVHGLGEIPTELGQQILERAQAGLDLTSPDALNEYGDTLYQTLLVGPTIGAGAGIHGRSAAKSQLEAQAPAAGTPTTTEQTVQAERLRRQQLEQEQTAPPVEIPPLPTSYAELEQQKQSLLQGPKTPEVKTRLAEIKQAQTQLAAQDVANKAKDITAQQGADESAFAAQEPQQMEMREATVEQPAGATPPAPIQLAPEVTPTDTRPAQKQLNLPLKTTEEQTPRTLETKLAPLDMFGKPIEEQAPQSQERQELVSQYDAIARELDRLKAQFHVAPTKELQDQLFKKGEQYQANLDELTKKVAALDAGKTEVTAPEGEQQRLDLRRTRAAEPVRTLETPAAPAPATPTVEAKTTEPTIFKPTQLTPETVPTKVSPEVLGALGIGRTAILRKPDHAIHQMDIANPAEAAQVKNILDVYKQGKSEGIVQKVDAYLARPEFKAVKEAPSVKVQQAVAPKANVGTTESGVRVPEQQRQVPAGQPKSLKAVALERAVRPTEPVASGEGKPAPALKAEKKAVAPKVEEKAPAIRLPKAMQPKPVKTAFGTVAKEETAAPVKEAVEPHTVEKLTRLIRDAYGVKHRDAKEMVEAVADSFGTVPAKEVTALLDKLDKTSPKAKYKLAEKGIVSADKAAVESLAKRISSGWKNIPPIITVQSVTDLPAHLQEQIKRDEVSPQGAFDPETGSVYLIADNIRQGDGAAVAIVVAHEVLGHYGLRSVLGESYANVMQSIYNGNEEVRKQANEKIKSSKNLDQNTAVEEVLAEMAERGMRPSGIQKIITTIREFFQKLGVPLKGVTDGQVLKLIAQSGKYVIEGGKAGEGSIPIGGAVYSAKKITSEFGDATNAAIEKIQAQFPQADQEPINSTIGQALNGVQTAREKAGIITAFRQATADKFATVESKVSQMFSKGVRDSFGNLNPMVLIRQAEDSAKVVMDFFRSGGIGLTKDGIIATSKNPASMVSALKQVSEFAKQEGISYEEAKSKVSTVLEGHRLFSLREEHNADLEKSARILEGQGKTKEAAAERDRKIKLHMTNEEIDTLEAAYKKSKTVQAIQDTLNDTRGTAIDLMIATGRISKEKGEFWKSNAAYVPFSRIFEDTPGPLRFVRGSGIASLRQIPGMEGSLGRPVKNVLDAYSNRLAWMVEDTMKNHASIKLLEAMELGGFARELKVRDQANNKNLVVELYRDGKKVFFEVQNEYDMAAFMQSPEVINWFTKGLGSIARGLRISITAMPPFAIKQVIEDAQRAMVYSGVKRPMVVAMKTIYNMPRVFFGEVTGKKSPMVRRMQELGIIGDYDFNVYRPTTDIEKEIGATKRGVAGKVFHTLEQFTKASDLAARLAVYEETMRETKGDELLAQTRSRELINFSRRGSSATMRTAARVIPFFNAYVQGMDVLYRSATGLDSSSGLQRTAARKMFWSRISMLTAMGFIYALAMGDDDGYKDADESVRDNNWLLPNGMKLPVPKELGFIFKSIPERIVDNIRRNGTDEEQSVLDALGSVVKGAVSAYGSPTAVPSAIRPALENMTNYSFFMQRELESASLKRKEPGYRSTGTTSEIAKAIGETTNISPIKIDNLLKGMFGIAGSTTLMMGDAILNPTRPDRPAYQMPFGSIFLYDTIGSRAKNEFYDLQEKVGQAKSTFDGLKETDPDKAASYLEKHAELIGAAPMLNSTLKQLSELRRMRTIIEQGTDEMLGMTGKERRELMDEIRQQEKEAVSYVRTLKKELSI